MNENNYFKNKIRKINVVKSSDNLFINKNNKNKKKQYYPNINNIHIKNNFIKLNKLKKYNSQIFKQINNIN